MSSKIEKNEIFFTKAEIKRQLEKISGVLTRFIDSDSKEVNLHALNNILLVLLQNKTFNDSKTNHFLNENDYNLIYNLICDMQETIKCFDKYSHDIIEHIIPDYEPKQNK